MVYVDTSVWVALVVPEAKSGSVLKWFASTRMQFASSIWCLTEFASALGIKQRRGDIDAEQAAAGWQRFERLTVSDLTLLEPASTQFHRAAVLALAPASGLRAADALHLACAEQAGVGSFATLDQVQARGAQQLKMKLVPFP